MYEATWESVRTHQVPQWYDDAKLGVFLHWGLYSVPGWAPQVPDIQELLLHSGPKRMLWENPYAEWYRNTMQLKGSPTWQHHRDTYGGAPYDNFVETFNDASSGADLDALADLCRRSGAGYVVLTTKHHEGFTLWPADTPHPTKGRYHARRDLVGDLSTAVRAAGLEMGLYYSGGYDWPYNDAIMRRPADAVLAVPTGRAYLDFVTAHVRELIDRYQPTVLWNDIGWPSGGNLAELFAYYYNTVEDGVINDRWVESTLPRNRLADTALGLAGDLVQLAWRFIPENRKQLTFGGARHFDFRTPEYSQFDRIPSRKWESTRGVGHSFGANRNERPEDIITPDALIRLLCQVVSMNGNLLIGIGPAPDGTIPLEQQVPLRGLGTWMAQNREAIVGTRPWEMPTSSTTDGTEVRFTQRDGHVYALVFGRPGSATWTISRIEALAVTSVSLLGLAQPLDASSVGGSLTITAPDQLQEQAVYALDLGTDVRARL
ncbi:MAG TPA: alpha-L-fucosidase [Acidimicrobiales bacterium]